MCQFFSCVFDDTGKAYYNTVENRKAILTKEGVNSYRFDSHSHIYHDLVPNEVKDRLNKLALKLERQGLTTGCYAGSDLCVSLEILPSCVYNNHVLNKEEYGILYIDKDKWYCQVDTWITLAPVSKEKVKGWVVSFMNSQEWEDLKKFNEEMKTEAEREAEKQAAKRAKQARIDERKARKGLSKAYILKRIPPELRGSINL